MKLNGEKVQQLMRAKEWSAEDLCSQIKAITGRRCHFSVVRKLMEGNSVRTLELFAAMKLLGCQASDLTPSKTFQAESLRETARR